MFSLRILGETINFGQPHITNHCCTSTFGEVGKLADLLLVFRFGATILEQLHANHLQILLKKKNTSLHINHMHVLNTP